MPQKHENTQRIGGPGAAHENRKDPDAPKRRNPPPEATKSTRHSGVSGGGGEPDSHHSHDPAGKAGD